MEMIKKEGFVQTICEGGSGSEAHVLVQARTIFPGIGGTLKSEEVVIAAMRQEYCRESAIGHRIFFIHLLLKKYDDFHRRVGCYQFPHIARPLGSQEDAYFYEWVHGKETFPWEYTRPDRGSEKVILKEWNAFLCGFEDKGILMGSHRDVVEPDGIMSQNIVHQLFRGSELDLNFCWKRIDFGKHSLFVDYDMLGSYLARDASPSAPHPEKRPLRPHDACLSASSCAKHAYLIGTAPS